MSLTYYAAVEQTITAGEQIHQIVNGAATTEVTVEDGSKVPSIRKALLDNFYFKTPIAWQAGQTEDVFNQLRQFTDGSWWYAPSATASNPVSMGITPIGNPLWKVYSVGTAVSRSITPVGDTTILDLASATVFRVTLNANITQIVFTNASGEEGSTRQVTLILRQGTGVNLTSWPENIRWAYGHLPVLSYEKDAEDYITLVRFGADAHWYGFLTGGWFHV